MAQPQEPIIVFEPDDGLCAYPTPESAVGHDYGEQPPEWFDQLQFFDARGRRLRPVGASSQLEVESEQDHSAYIRERVRRSVEEARQRIEDLGDSTDQREAWLFSEFLLAATAFLKCEPKWPLNQVASELTSLLGPSDPSRFHPTTPGRWGHYATAAHHKR
jgi:hypothetical protein